MMKQLINKAFLGAIAFVSAIGFSACSDDNVVAETNPNYNPETGEVTTQFVLNVATSNTPTTRMSAFDTQADVTSASGFRGITNAQLFTFKLGTSNDGKHVSTAAQADKVYSFGTILNPGALDPNGDGSSTPKSHRVVELSLPTETNALIFYGKAPKTGTDNDQGKVDWKPAADGDLANDEASLCRIVPDQPYEENSIQHKAALLQYENLIAHVLTEIVRSNIPAQTITFGTGSNAQSVTLSKPLSWGDFVEVSGTDTKTLAIKTSSPIDPNGTMCALGEILSKEFVTLNTIYSGELRAGCGEAIAYMMKDLMVPINSVANATATSLQEAVAQKVGIAIKENIEKYFDADNDYKWKSAGTVKSTMTGVLADDKKYVQETSDLNEFPTDFELPLGSVILQFVIGGDKTNGFTFTYAYKGTIETYAMGGSVTDAFDPLNYTYPAELCYFGNSPIRVTDQTVATKDYPDGVAEWDADASWTSKQWTPSSHVLSSTRSVAMQYNINYGTALLKTQVRYGAQVLEDNNKKIQKDRTGATEANNTIEVKTSDQHFVLTGILVGGQEAKVGWNYLAKATTPGFGSMVYDNCGTVNIPKAEAENGGNPSNAVYTLLWDNWQKSNDGKQRVVYVALEFKNNSKGFWGKNNFIREGATFYIVGKLDPDALVTQEDGESTADYLAKGITWPTKYALPPYDENGNTIKQRRVFIQDYMTTATFVIGPQSLQEALVAVPDLRSGQLSLGLSVDLKWQTGLNFDNVILGKE